MGEAQALSLEEREKILVVEDEAIISMLIQTCLKNKGYTVCGTAASGAKAIAQIEQERPDLILMDIRLKGDLNGIDTTRKILARWDIPVIYLTAHSDTETLQQALETAPFGYLLKPFREDSLFTAIETALYKHRMENRLRDSEEKYKKLATEFRTLLNGIPDSLCLLSPELKVIWTNLGTTAMFELREDEIVGAHCTELCGCADCESCAVLKCFDSRRTEESLCELPGGRILKIKAFPLEGGANETDSVIRLVSDITEKEQHRVEGLHLSRLAALGELVAGVAHEINNPNGAILLNIDILRDVVNELLTSFDESIENEDFLVGAMPYAKVRDQVPQMMDDIRFAARQVKHIVDDLKEFSRQETPSLQRTNAAVNIIVRQSVNLVQSYIKEATDTFTLDLAGDLPDIQLDQRQISQVLVSLLINACQALPNRSHALRVTTLPAEDNGSIVIKVEDEGVGISAEDLPNITSPFFTTKRAEGGTGLGLPIAARIVAEHGGHLRFSSQPERGTCVTLTLPVN